MVVFGPPCRARSSGANDNRRPRTLPERSLSRNWERPSGFSGEFADLIANGFMSTSPVVAISGGDAGFVSSNCGTWTKIG